MPTTTVKSSSNLGCENCTNGQSEEALPHEVSACGREGSTCHASTSQPLACEACSCTSNKAAPQGAVLDFGERSAHCTTAADKASIGSVDSGEFSLRSGEASVGSGKFSLRSGEASVDSTATCAEAGAAAISPLPRALSSSRRYRDRHVYRRAGIVLI